ncbi:hypothetical protein NQ176_g5823 [Zarea fungicola]|uniref:Uncharacterized protein n=1 Tax=Zarea fungicola TaxID=93591 RepID=A0ACC1N7A3_9HYPO|nr:hypothetical protein NQ176_g5823 [Lecanicillium fungicola]
MAIDTKMKDILIDVQYRLDYKIGEGGFGLVYAGTDTVSNNEVAIKLMHVSDDPEILKAEADTYKVLSGGIGIPQVLWFGQECDYYALVHDLLGPSLEDLFNYCDRRFSIKTVLLIADQAISRIQYIHSKGFLHRDIKPDNFLMGTGTKGNILYAIDFGLSKEFCNAERFQTLQGRPFGGTRRYASLNNHNGREQSWGDDLESLGYVLLYFARGSLPWQGLKAATEMEKNELIKYRKLNISVTKLCEGLPGEFATYISYTRALKFEDRPNYAYLRRLFRQALVAYGFNYDNIYDWTERRFYEIHGDVETIGRAQRACQRTNHGRRNANYALPRETKRRTKVARGSGVVNAATSHHGGLCRTQARNNTRAASSKRTTSMRAEGKGCEAATNGEESMLRNTILLDAFYEA